MTHERLRTPRQPGATAASRRSGAGSGFDADDLATLRSLSDDEVLGGLSQLLRQSRRCEAGLVAHIGEVDARRLYAREAFPSMFAYCTQGLHLSEQEAYWRIAVARAARQHPMLLTMLRDGRLHLSGIVKLAPHLTKENRKTLLARAAHKTKRQIEELVAELAPQPDVPSVVRKLPQRRSVSPPAPGPLRSIPAHATGTAPGPGPGGGGCEARAARRGPPDVGADFATRRATRR